MIHGHDSLSADVMALWESGGLARGDYPGWPSLEKHYSIAPAQLSIVTGAPGSGKSEFMDAIMVNLAKNGEWKFVIYSPENAPISTHIAKIVEKYVHRPFNPGVNTRVDKEQLENALHWMKGKFIFAKPERADLVSILDVANTLTDPIETPQLRALRLKWKKPDAKTGVIIDPWNQIEHDRLGMNETDYVGAMLSMAMDWVRVRNAHVWIVAHPAKPMRDPKTGKYPVPTPYDIAGSAHWFNKADNCLSVWRDRAAKSGTKEAREVEIHVQKIRFKHICYEGMVTLNYNRITGEYSERLQSVNDEEQDNA